MERGLKIVVFLTTLMFHVPSETKCLGPSTDDLIKDGQPSEVSFYYYKTSNDKRTGFCDELCTIDQMSVDWRKTGNKVQGKTEWVVYVLNQCSCSQDSIYLWCSRFESIEPVDQNILRPTTDDCLFMNGAEIRAYSVRNFTYAWDEEYYFDISSSRGLC